MAKTVAERQAEYRKRLAAQGKIQRLITMDAASWQMGFDAGRNGHMDYPPLDCPDRLAWFSGFIEGKAKAAK